MGELVTEGEISNMDELIEYLRGAVSLEASEDALILHTPIMYIGADRPFSFELTRAGECGYSISDRGRTLNFLSGCCDISRYTDRIMSTLRHFSANLEGDSITAFIPSLKSGQTGRAISNYLLLVGIIANLYLI